VWQHRARHHDHLAREAQVAHQTRRLFLQTSAIAAGATLAALYIKSARSAGTLSLGMWDHWVPGANDVLAQMCRDWGQQNGTEITLDFITSIGFKNQVTAAAEARARTGHDIFALPTWDVTIHWEVLEPVDDLIEEQIKQYGPYTDAAAQLCLHDGVWRAIPAPTGSQHTYPMVSRLDLWKEHAGIDIQELSPARPRDQARVDAEWTYDNFLEARRRPSFGSRHG
jgi:hypothetical protein